jgi:hypothetical protein
VRQHQESDIVEEGGEFQIVQQVASQTNRLSDQQRDRSRASTVACMPGERAIQLPAHLLHKDVFDIMARCDGKLEAVDFSEHPLYRDDPRVNLFTDAWRHRHVSKKT